MNSRSLIWFALISIVLLCCATASAADARSWDGAAFAAKAGDLAQAGSAVESAKGFDATVMLDERDFTVDENGSTRQRFHLIYRVNTDAGVKNWSSAGVNWEPWHQKQPIIRARVITADGIEHVLDPKTLSDTPTRQYSADLYSDTRTYRGPLPAVAIGSVVEEEITIEDTAPAISGGVVERIFVGRRVPVNRIKLTLRAPSSVPLNYEVRLIPGAQIDKKSIDGFQQVTIEAGPLDAIERSEPNIPSDAYFWPQVEFSTVTSWQQVAKKYKEMSDPQIRIDDVRELVNQTVLPGDSRAEKIRKLTAKLHQAVRYTGVEFGQSSLVPQPPAEVIRRKYGDCKDKATLLVAMLRAAGIPANLVLLNAGQGQDVSQKLPGANLFNHAIVFVPGKPELWIDATDEFSLPGQLAVGDQGRRALLIAEQGELRTTPRSTTKDNLLIENREFYLSEHGPARVVETSESYGNADRNYRSYYGTNRDSKKVEKEIEDYIKSAYASDQLIAFERGDGTDLTKPFLFRIEAGKAKRGYTSLRDSKMAVQPAAVVSRLPEFFKKSDDDLKKEKAKTIKPVPARTEDYELPFPFVSELRYKIVPPPGFKVRALPDNRAQDMGPAKYSQTFAENADGSVSAVLRFDTVKDRYTVAEAEALRKAVVELRNSKSIIVAFDNLGYSLLSAGKTKEGINAFESLVKLHPKEAIHRIQIADGLLEAGLGEAARAEAEQAVLLEPDSAIAHRTYGWILQHDLIGRRMKKGFDLAGAIAQYKKAVELSPDDDDTRIDYAILLEYDADGERYSERADIKGAIEQYRELKNRKSTWSALDNNLLFALYYSGQYKEVESLAATLDPDSSRVSLTIASRCVLEGSEACIKKSLELTSDEKSRMEALVNAANRLLNNRIYQPAADLLSKVNTGESSLEIITAIKKSQKWESLSTSDKDASGFVFKALTLVAGPSKADPRAAEMFLVPPQPKKKQADKDERLKALRLLGRWLRNTAASDLPQDARGDVFLSNAKLTAEGDDATGHRVTVQSLGLDGYSFYVTKDSGRFQILPYDELTSSMARVALARLRAGNIAAARKWLDWAREEQTLRTTDDPLEGAVFPRLWRKGQNGDKAACERAAAALLVDDDDIEPLLPVLLSGRENARDDMQRTAFDLGLYHAYATLERWKDARQVAERLLQASADSTTAFKSYAYSSIQLKDWKAAEKAANQRLEANAEDQDAIEVLQDVADRQNKLGESIDIIRRALKTAKPRASLLNNYAWNTLFRPPVPDDAMEAAQKAVRLTDNKEFGVIHTLAAIYAEVGRLGEARQLLLQIMDGTGQEEPSPEVWYVFARIAEQYGRKDAALNAYKRVKTEDPEPRPNSTFVLAQRGLQRLQTTPATSAVAK